MMKKWQKYFEVIRYSLYMTFIAIIIANFYDDLGNLILYLSLFLFAITNDYLRYKDIIKSDMKYYLSVAISIFIGGILRHFVDGYMEIYLYVIMVEIPWIINKKAVKVLYTLDVLTLLFVDLYRSSILNDISIIDVIREDFMGLVFKLLMISFISVSIFSYVALVVERNKVLKLNKEIEELTISKERNRIAQDIHDNLGHSLVALNMNLDVISNIIDDNKDKAKELLIKCQHLTKESMDSLRKAVYTLKEEDLSRGLIGSLKALIDNINETSKIDISYHIDESIENVPLELKSIIYTTIKESLTNSIKHGKSTEIDIVLNVSYEIRLEIKDNGIGCKNIVKGNGLMGIENRIYKINGHVEYNTEEGKGFEIRAIIPI